MLEKQRCANFTIVFTADGVRSLCRPRRGSCLWRPSDSSPPACLPEEEEEEEVETDVTVGVRCVCVCRGWGGEVADESIFLGIATVKSE